MKVKSAPAHTFHTVCKYIQYYLRFRVGEKRHRFLFILATPLPCTVKLRIKMFACWINCASVSIAVGIDCKGKGSISNTHHPLVFNICLFKQQKIVFIITYLFNYFGLKPKGSIMFFSSNHLFYYSVHSTSISAPCLLQMHALSLNRHFCT